MTRKRFKKLAYSEMAKIMQGSEKAGQVLKAVQKYMGPDWNKYKSYQECWDMLRVGVFEKQQHNKDRIVPVK